TPPGVPVTINDGSSDSVTIGEAGIGVQGVLSPVTINSPFQRTDLTVNNADDPSSHTAVIDTGAVTGLTPNPISYTGSQLKSLMVKGGRGSSDYFVQSTPTVPANTDGTVGVPVTLIVGGDLGSVYGAGTSGVIVGQNGTLDFIQGQLTVRGVPGAIVHLLLEDQMSTGHGYLFTKPKLNELARDGAAPIYYDQLASLIVKGGGAPGGSSDYFAL